MTRPRVHPRTALLAALALFASAFAPVVPPCASEAKAPCEEQMDHGAPMGHESMPMTGHDPVEPPASELPRTMVGMPCCTITATVAPRGASTTFVAVAAVMLPALLVAPRVTPPVPAPDAAPPDRRIPLHIALGRFLT